MLKLLQQRLPPFVYTTRSQMQNVLEFMVNICKNRICLTLLQAKCPEIAQISQRVHFLKLQKKEKKTACSSFLSKPPTEQRRRRRSQHSVPRRLAASLATIGPAAP